MTASTPTPTVSDITTRAVTDADRAAIAALHARVFGPGRLVRTAYRVREGTPFASAYCRAALIGDRIVAALRMTPVAIGGSAGALMLGPLAVDPDFANLGHGRRLIAEAIELARARDERLVLLVGDLAYYGRLGFKPVLPPGRIALPGPADPARILALELVEGSAAAYGGMVNAAG